MEDLKKNEQFRMLDVAKLFAAIMVIALHTTPFKDVNTFLDKSFIGICRFGVPFFFFASAYLYFRKPNPIKNYENYVKRIFKYWVFFSVLSIVCIKPPFGVGMVRTFLFDGYGVCWFFHGLIVSVGIVCMLLFLTEKIGWGIVKCLLYALPCVLYVMGTLMNTYFSLLPENIKIFLETYYFTPFVTARNGFFGGTVYALMGYFMAKNKVKKKKITFCLVGLLISASLFLGELFISWHLTEKIHGREMFITMPFLVIFVFFMLRELETRYGNKLNPQICFLCRKISFAMYGWQIVYLTVIPGTLNSMVRFILVTTCTAVTGILLVYLSRKTKLQKITSIMI